MNRSPPPVAARPKYELDNARPPFAPLSDGDATEKGDKGTPDRSRKPHHLPETKTQTRYGDSVLINFLAPDRPDIAAFERDDSLTDSFRQDRSPVEKKPPILDGLGGLKKSLPLDPPKEPPKPIAAAPVHPQDETTTPGDRDPPVKDHEPSLSPRNKLPSPLPRLAPSGDITTSRPLDFKSPLQRPHRPSISTLTYPDRRLSIDQPPPLKDIKQSPDLNHRISLPSLPSLQSLSPPSSCAATSPDNSGVNGNGNGNGNTQVLPSIHSALSGLSPSDFPPSRLNGISPYSYPPSTSSQADSPHDRLPRQFFPQQIPPSPFSHFSPVSAKEASNNPSPSQSYWRTQAPPAPPPPPPPPSQPAETPHNAPTPYDMSPMTTKSPATSYPTPTEQVAPTPPAGERDTFNGVQQPNGLAAPGSYRCTHPGCTAAPFQTQYLLK